MEHIKPLNLTEAVSYDDCLKDLFMPGSKNKNWAQKILFDILVLLLLPPVAYFCCIHPHVHRCTNRGNVAFPIWYTCIFLKAEIFRIAGNLSYLNIYITCINVSYDHCTSSLNV